jgi:hypothetical protein
MGEIKTRTVVLLNGPELIHGGQELLQVRLGFWLWQGCMQGKAVGMRGRWNLEPGRSWVPG